MPKLRINAPDGRPRSVLLEPMDHQGDLNEILRTRLAEVRQILPTEVCQLLADARLIIADRDIERFLGILKSARLKGELDTYRFEVEER